MTDKCKFASEKYGMMKLYLGKVMAIVMICAATVAAHAQNKLPAQTAKVKTSIRTTEITFKCDTQLFRGYIAYDTNIRGPRPAVLVLPEWWGYGDYVKMRARMLADMGYIAMAVDLYGQGREAKNVEEAQALSAPFYKDLKLAGKRVDAAMHYLRLNTEADPAKMAMIGYCFGGSMALNCAKQGMDLRAVVSFHGGLTGARAVRNKYTGRILVCHGGADKFVSAEEVAAFRANMDSAGFYYHFIEYPGATHAFSNPAATTIGKKFNLPIEYNPDADKRSWRDMQGFLREAFIMRSPGGRR